MVLPQVGELIIRFGLESISDVDRAREIYVRHARHPMAVARNVPAGERLSDQRRTKRSDKRPPSVGGLGARDGENRRGWPRAGSASARPPVYPGGGSLKKTKRGGGRGEGGMSGRGQARAREGSAARQPGRRALRPRAHRLEGIATLHDPTFSRAVWRLYGGAKGLVMWYYHRLRLVVHCARQIKRRL